MVDSGTSSTRGARAHARAQAGAEVPFRPMVPASGAEVVDRDGTRVEASRVLWDEVVGPGGDAAKVVPRGTTVRFVDVDGDTCANVLLYNATRPVERLNVADTVKVQWQAYLGAGSLLLSDMGRVLATIVVDTSGRHDALCGASTRRSNELRYGDGAASGPCPSARDRFAVALAKHGLDRRDIVPNVNFFKGVVVEPDGALRFVDTLDGHRAPGAVVELRAEMALLVVVANTPHVLDPRPQYTAGPLHVSAWAGEPTGRDDAEWSATPEATRAFLQTEEFLLEGTTR
ncbi:MAG TPA: urea amidolyase associated protein UAAP1 [Acidimicrobiia bacterium]|nr:urea amidolyase associated protein UAAP1 [Acidimicrobiia bacterium]